MSLKKKSYSKAEVLCNSFALVQEKMKLRREPYTIYSEKIKCEDVEDDRIFYYVYDDITYEIKVSRKYYSDYLALFEKGILHPNLIGVCFFENKARIAQFEESIYWKEGSKRRYKLWSWCAGLANPCEYTIELLNKEATTNTPTKDFVEGATISYVSICSVII